MVKPSMAQSEHCDCDLWPTVSLQLGNDAAAGLYTNTWTATIDISAAATKLEWPRHLDRAWVANGYATGTASVYTINLSIGDVCEVVYGCTDDTACNYDVAATNEETPSNCVFASGCDTCSGATDGTGTVVDGDSDDDGVCDEFDNCVPIESACNYDGAHCIPMPHAIFQVPAIPVAEGR